MPRGNPLDEEHDVELRLKFDIGLKELLTAGEHGEWESTAAKWDKTLTLKSSRAGSTHHHEVLAGIPDTENETKARFGEFLKKKLQQREDTNYLSLDSDRAYPAAPVPAHQFAEAFDADWETPEFRRQRAHTTSRKKYDEWMKYCVGTEAQAATELTQAIRKAREEKKPDPEFVDAFEGYRSSIEQVLPHLHFRGVVHRKRTIVFDSAGLELEFKQLSGGEREIAFIVGQIERFRLRQGLLLIDEPELHLNPELVRRWVAYLRDTVEDGQVWIATHSMEAVEAAGPASTYILDRNPKTRKVSLAASFADRPIFGLLSAAVGSPAFSLVDRRFVFIEGDRQGVERDRYFNLLETTGGTENLRFMEAGSCSEVVRKLEASKLLAEESDEQLHVGGIIDRDWRTEEEIRELQEQGLFVLPVHEVENLYLFPDALDPVLKSLDRPEDAHEVVRGGSDPTAGRWILEAAARTFGSQVARKTIGLSREWNWQRIHEAKDDFVSELVAVAGLVEDLDIARLRNELLAAVRRYETQRDSKAHWKECMGKETLRQVAALLGFRHVRPLTRLVSAALRDNGVPVPAELASIREYIDRLS